MAFYAYARCLFFFVLALSFSLQTHARDSKFFNKVTKTTKENHDSIRVSPALSPSLAPAPEPVPEVVEHGYGLYGRDPYDRYAPTTENPTKTPIFGEKEHVGVQDLGNNDIEKGYPVETPQEVRKNNYAEFQKGHSLNGNGNEYGSEKQGMSDTRFLENGKYYYDVSQEGKEEHKYVENEESKYVNGNGNEKQGMSDTRFLDNGKYYHDVNHDGKEESKYAENEGNEFENRNEKQGMSDTKFMTVEDKGNEYRNGKGDEKQGMSDTRFLENGKYYHDVNQESKEERKYSNIKENGYGYGNGKQGMSDTRFLENGKYYYDVNQDGKEERKYSNIKENEHGNGNGNGNENGNQGMSDTRFLENGKYYYDVNEDGKEVNKQVEKEEKGVVNGVQQKEFVHLDDIRKDYEDKKAPTNMQYNTNNEEFLNNDSGYRNGNGNEESYHSGYEQYNENTKKLPNQYDTMEEYDREQGIYDP